MDNQTANLPPRRHDPTGIDAFKPSEVAQRIEEAGVTKAALAAIPLITLSVMAGIFIALGAAAYAAVMANAELGFGPARLLGGIVFSMGLILVVVAGAELFTGNTLIMLAFVDGRVSLKALLRNWALAFTGNLIGALIIVTLMALTGLLAGPAGDVVKKVAEAKANLPWDQALARGILCNVLVCLAVWLTFAARSVTDKILAVIFPIAGFVLMGFEHSIANMYFIPAGWAAGANVTLGGFIANLIPVTIGNIIGGSGGVALTYRLAYGAALKR